MGELWVAYWSYSWFTLSGLAACTPKQIPVCTTVPLFTRSPSLALCGHISIQEGEANWHHVNDFQARRFIFKQTNKLRIAFAAFSCFGMPGVVSFITRFSSCRPFVVSEISPLQVSSLPHTDLTFPSDGKNVWTTMWGIPSGRRNWEL